MLADGTYDVFVLEADPTGAQRLHLSLAVVAGAQRGHVIELEAENLPIAAVDAIGMPATLTVSGGVPHLVIDDA